MSQAALLSIDNCEHKLFLFSLLHEHKHSGTTIQLRPLKHSCPTRQKLPLPSLNSFTSLPDSVFLNLEVSGGGKDAPPAVP